MLSMTASARALELYGFWWVTFDDERDRHSHCER